MDNLIRDFISWYNYEFKQTDLYMDMQNTVEGSPWHREANVAVHTDMVVMTLLEYQDCRVGNERLQYMLNALIAAAFHDVGKPSMRTEKHSTERGTYYSFAEHELRSARLWQDYYMTNREMFKSKFNIGFTAFYEITVMIEKHRPWGMKDVSKINGIFSSIGTIQSRDYLKLLLADNAGRITDDPDAFSNTISLVSNLAEMRNSHQQYERNISKTKFSLREKLKSDGGMDIVPRLVMPISPAGSGKSTLLKKLQESYQRYDYYHHSMDLIRTERYGPDAEVAFRMSCDDKEFKSVVQADFISAIKNHRSVYVDNTNLSAKRRRFYITEARRRGYEIVAYIIPLSIQQSIDRNAARSDKTIGSDVVMRQYMSMSMPQKGSEFDTICFVE